MGAAYTQGSPQTGEGVTQIFVPQFIVLPQPPTLPAVTGGAPQPVPPQPEFTKTTSTLTEADPMTTGAEPEHTIPLQGIQAE